MANITDWKCRVNDQGQHIAVTLDPVFHLYHESNVNSSALDTEEGSKPSPGVLGIVEVSIKLTRRSPLYFM